LAKTSRLLIAHLVASAAAKQARHQLRGRLLALFLVGGPAELRPCR
jgi:hypothetical protein